LFSGERFGDLCSARRIEGVMSVCGEESVTFFNELSTFVDDDFATTLFRFIFFDLSDILQGARKSAV
jgi:hypothetical protein